MIVNIEFLDKDPIENAITGMNYDIQKTIFVGFKELIDKRKNSLTRFLKKYCAIQEIEYVQVPHSDFQKIMAIMTEVVTREKNKGNKVFFDITGGDCITLVAFGIIARQLDVPLHIYNVTENRLIELEDREDNITDLVAKTPFIMTLDKYIELHGGIINYKRQKGYKDLKETYNKEDVQILWSLSRKHLNQWNHFSMFLAALCAEHPELTISLDSHEVISMNNKLHHFSRISEFNYMLDECSKAGIMQNVHHTDGKYCFTFKTKMVKNCLLEAGSILELYVYTQMMKDSEVVDCRVGVHIDWDGIIQENAGYDVLNEVDVLFLKGNTPTFISCKNGNVDQRALYELETVADRFGGKYAKRVLAISKAIGAGHRARAEEMNIEVKSYTKEM